MMLSIFISSNYFHRIAQRSDKQRDFTDGKSEHLLDESQSQSTHSIA